jgi:GTP1/Obg family GTP-binding protein
LSILVDLEDEQKRYHSESQRLVSDVQRITQDLDHETTARVRLQQVKQSLEQEIHRLKATHAQTMDELRQAKRVTDELDPAHFFRGELADAVRNIREEYEQLNHQQRTELESWYRMKVAQAVSEGEKDDESS